MILAMNKPLGSCQLSLIRLKNIYRILNHQTISSQLQLQRLSSTNSPVHTSNHSRSLKTAKIGVNGVEFNYTQAGHGEHKVLLLPGALGSSVTDFMPQLTGLDANKYTLICFDPQGYGRSRPPDRDWPLLFLQRDAHDAAALMKTLGVKSFSVLGWSDGGITGMILAEVAASSVQRLMIWGANAYITEQDMKLFKSIEDIDQWSPKMRAPFIEVYGEEYFRNQWKQWVKAYNNYYTARKGDICIASLPNIKCPTLIVNGHKDYLVPQEHPLFLKKHIPTCRMVDWPEGKHNLHLRYATEFNALAEEFLDDK